MDNKTTRTITITLTEEEHRQLFNKMASTREFVQACIDNIISRENILSAEYENLTATREMLESINLELNNIQFEICVP